jgi:hypothetical protein
MFYIIGLARKFKIQNVDILSCKIQQSVFIGGFILTVLSDSIFNLQ